MVWSAILEIAKTLSFSILHKTLNLIIIKKPVSGAFQMPEPADSGVRQGDTAIHLVRECNSRRASRQDLSAAVKRHEQTAR